MADTSNVKRTTLHDAPEVIRGRRKLKSDMWSFGITLFELAEGKNPFEDVDWGKEEDAICDKDPPSLSSEKWSATFVDFVSKCIVKNVKERMSVNELMNVSLVLSDDE